MQKLKLLSSAVLLATSLAAALGPAAFVLYPRPALADGHGNCAGREYWSEGRNYGERAQVVFAPDGDHNHLYSAKVSVASSTTPDQDTEHWSHLGVCK
jgi:hypothetical protein